MCGLVGVAGNLFKRDIDAFSDLLWCDAVRGMDSTGVASVFGNGQIKWVKQVGPPSELTPYKSYDEVVSMNARVIIGHNRAGTMGAKSKANAHPFVLDGIVGAHNGTVDYPSKNRMKNGMGFGTDSEAIFNNIDLEGPDETIPKLDGAWALSYYDRINKTFNLIRNKERPLHYCFTKDHKVLYWSSEIGLLMWVLNRRGVEVDKFQQLPVDLLHTWDVPEGSKEWGEPLLLGIEGFKKPPQAVANFRHPYGEYELPERYRSGTPAGNGGSSSNNNSGPKPENPESPGDSSKVPTSATIIAALESIKEDDDWWNNSIIVNLPFAFGGDTAWSWNQQENIETWMKRCLVMLKLGWTWGDADASPALTPPKKPAVVIHHDVLKPIFNSANTQVWNPVLKKFQVMPEPNSPVFWNKYLNLWVFEESDTRWTEHDKIGKEEIAVVELIEELKRPPTRITADVKKAVDDWEKFRRLSEKLDSGKKLTKAEEKWFSAYETGDDAEYEDDPPFEVTPEDRERSRLAYEAAKEEAKGNVRFLASTKYVNPETKSEMTEAEFNIITAHGCDWCQKSINWGDKARFHRASDCTECFCEECITSQPDVQHYLRIA